MGIALTGGSARNPTPKFKLQFGGSVIPGYCQSLDDPLRMRLAAHPIDGRSGDLVSRRGSDSRPVNASMRILSRLDHVDGLTHLNDCMEQYREALAIVARQPAYSSLYLGDSDRYLPRAYFESASLPLAAPDHRAVTFTLSFRADTWYRSTTTSSVTRETISATRVSGTTSGSTSYANAHFSGTKGLFCNASGEHVSLPVDGSLTTDAGTITFWLRPDFASTFSTSSRIFTRVSGTGASNSAEFWDLKWHPTTKRVAVSGSTTGLYVTAPAITFASGAHVFVCLTWDNTGTRIYAGPSGGSLVTSSSATTLFSNVAVPSLWHVGGTKNAFSNCVLSDLVTFSSALTAAQVSGLHTRTSPFDPMDTDYPTTMLLDHPLNSTVIANSSSNSLYLDIGDSRAVAPTIELYGTGTVTFSGNNTGKVLSYSGSANPAVTVDCGQLTAIDTNGRSQIAKVTNVNFGMAFSGSQRIGLLNQGVTGSFDATLTVVPEYER